MDFESDDLQDNQEEEQQLQIHVPQEVQRGCYANQFITTHSAEEFVLDFILATPPAGVVNSRVIVSPAHAKRIVSVLQENVSRYESIFGKIPSSAAPTVVPNQMKAH